MYLDLFDVQNWPTIVGLLMLTSATSSLLVCILTLVAVKDYYAYGAVCPEVAKLIKGMCTRALYLTVFLVLMALITAWCVRPDLSWPYKYVIGSGLVLMAEAARRTMRDTGKCQMAYYHWNNKPQETT